MAVAVFCAAEVNAGGGLFAEAVGVAEVAFLAFGAVGSFEVGVAQADVLLVLLLSALTRALDVTLADRCAHFQIGRFCDLLADHLFEVESFDRKPVADSFFEFIRGEAQD